MHACGAGEVLDVVRTHQFAIAKRRGDWDVIETAGHKEAKREIPFGYLRIEKASPAGAWR